MNTVETREKAERSIRNLGEGARDASRQLWLAGLGVASSVETESRRVFENLVERGRDRSEHDLVRLPRPLRATGERLKTLGQEIESRVEAGTSTALQRFGVPDRKEVTQLIERIEELTRKVEGLAESRG